ncbi:MAG: hypothetical protein ACLQVY_21135 [Limisphaerales bacterium]
MAYHVKPGKIPRLANGPATDFVESGGCWQSYPKIMAWDRLFDEGKHQALADVNAAVKRPGPVCAGALTSST